MRLLCIAAMSKKKGHVLINGRKPSAEDLAKLFGQTVGDVKNWLDELDQNGVFSKTKGGVIYNRHMVRVEKKRDASAKGGKIGGAVSRDKQRGIFSTPAPTQGATPQATPHPRRAPLPSPSPSYLSKKEEVVEPPADAGSKARALKRTQIGDYRPDEANRKKATEFWMAAGRPDLVARIEMQIDNFIAHHQNKGTLGANWNAGWYSWYSKAPEYTKAPNGHAGDNVVPFEDCSIGRWVKRLGAYYSTPTAERAIGWPPKWGPAPETSGCKVPAAAFDAFRAGRAE